MKNAVILLHCGLGNQMFIYAFGKALESSGIKVGYHLASHYEIASNECDDDKKHLIVKDNSAGILKQVELLDFDVKLDIEKDFKLENFLASLEKHPAYYWLWRALAKSLSVPKIRRLKKLMPNYRREYPFSQFYFFDNEYEKLESSKFLELQSAYFWGYWQDLDYFRHIDSTIKSEFRMKRALTPKNQETVNFIKSTKNSVFLHIRRGDYLNIETFNKLGQPYYESAIHYIKQKLGGSPHIFVFSNDTAWAKNEFPKTLSAECKNGVEFSFIDNNSINPQSSQAIEEMQLMRECENAIIANSSFSWWAAYLMENPQKIVISPSQWFNAERLKRWPKQLMFESMVLIDWQSGEILKE